MKYKIVKNEDRPTLTVIISPTVIGYVKFLYERYNGERFFASAVLKEAKIKEDIVPMVKDIVNQLNAHTGSKLPEGTQFTPDLFISSKDDGEYRLFGKNLDKDDKWDGQWQINLSSKAGEGKKFLFKNFQNPVAIPENDGWKYNYALELEISGGYSEDEFKPYVFTIFHRAFSVGKRDDVKTMDNNDSAWGGFDFGEGNEETPKKNSNHPSIDVTEDDLPF